MIRLLANTGLCALMVAGLVLAVWLHVSHELSPVIPVQHVTHTHITRSGEVGS